MKGALYRLMKVGGRRLTSRAEILPIDYISESLHKALEKRGSWYNYCVNHGFEMGKGGFITCSITWPPCHMTRAGTCIRVTAKHESDSFFSLASLWRL